MKLIIKPDYWQLHVLRKADDPTLQSLHMYLSQKTSCQSSSIQPHTNHEKQEMWPLETFYIIYIYIYKFTNFHGFLVIYYLSVCLSLLLKANYAEYLHAVLSCPKIKSVHIWTSCVFWFVFVERWQSSLFFGWLYIVYIPIVSVSRRGSWCETRI